MKDFVLKGNVCYSISPTELITKENAYVVCKGGKSCGVFIYYGLENAIKLVLFGSAIQTAVMLLLSAVNLIEKLIKKL